VTLPPELDVHKSAHISHDGLYRYRLIRRWSRSAPVLPFVMLNPSIADASRDDPTIVRCAGFARREGFGGIAVWNLYAYRATKPAAMWAARRKGVDIVGPENDRRLRNLLAWADGLELPVIAAWRPNAARDAARVAWLRKPGWRSRVAPPGALSKDGHPRHPLMLRKEAPLTRWAA